jgi:CubicO group peptidase (beta-lactamase class C family)
MRLRLFALPLLTLVALSRGARAELPKAPEPPRRFDVAAIDAYVAALVREQGTPGLALTIMRDGKVVLAQGYGKRALEEGAPVEPDTAFAVGSVTKQFACASVLLLAEEGKLSVDDKVAKYFPDLTRAGDITLYQLMTHTSGYPDFYPLDFVDRRLQKPIAVDAVIKDYAGGKLDFAPGARWSYSNTGYLILGRVVEKVSGESFGTFLDRRILRPVGMKDSAFEPGPGSSGRARGYLSFALGPFEPATPEAEGWVHAAGGLWASAPDLARWSLALMQGRVLKPDSFRLMTTPVSLADSRSKDYGCGLSVLRRDGETVLSHGGAVSGFRAYSALVPRTKSALVLLTNGEPADPALPQTLLGLVLEDEKQPDVPRVDGTPVREAALDFLHQMQAGQLDREKLGAEFSAYLSDERVRAAASRLKALGEPEKVEVETVRERGGMEVATIRFTFKSAVLEGLLYRTPDGKIQQLLFGKG